MDDLFHEMAEGVNLLFGESAHRQQWLKWREKLQKIRRDDFAKVEPMTADFARQMALAKQEEGRVREESVVDTSTGAKPDNNLSSGTSSNIS